MILLGLVTINSVNVYAGIILTSLGVVMFLVYRRLGKARGGRSEGSAGPAAQN
jgi:hypothetical protein